MLHPSAVTIRLHLLKAHFDQAILAGQSFEEVKKIYLEMKQIYAQREELHLSSYTLNPHPRDTIC